MSKNIAIIILAAGESRRYAGTSEFLYSSCAPRPAKWLALDTHLQHVRFKRPCSLCAALRRNPKFNLRV